MSSSLLSLPPPPPPVPSVASFSIFLILYHRLPHLLVPPSSFATATSAFFVRQAASYGGRRHNDGQTSNLKLLTESWVLWSSAPGRPTSGAASRFTSRWSLLWPRCRLVLSFSFRRLARARCFCRIESQTAKRLRKEQPGYGSTSSILFLSFCFLPILLADSAFSTKIEAFCWLIARRFNFPWRVLNWERQHDRIIPLCCVPQADDAEWDSRFRS